MRYRITIFSLFIMFVFLPGTFAGMIEIHLMEKIVLKDKVITVSDISTVTGDDPGLVKKVMGIEIGNTPGANCERRIDLNFIRMRLISSNVNIENVTFTNSQSTLVSVESTKIKGLEIVQKAKEYLLEFLPMDDRETTVEVGRVPTDQWVPSKRDNIDFFITLVDTTKDRGKIELIVSASSEGKRFFKVPVYFNVRVFEFVAVAKKKIRRNQSLTKENVILTRRETTRTRGMSFSSIDDLKGMITTTSVQPRIILTEHMVETPPTLKQGSIVKLIVKKSGFKIVTKGLAQQTGYKGDVIKVRNINSKKIIYGQIINHDSVQVIF
ncbi:flagellar basal body P-ring protein [Candidatus Scalindua japonica]|uniref:Flagellar basal body P-ring protein n=1 Tax=Candidatus Scalindua japonica TaxID=1284222 RepID=A0A286TV96_9BACT|nr:flagellar basal body P-ring formation chaperone FlgA [Candidatus Scalindua japonica]GAX59808.1 flagellar basal body P-ring protein [Candidatus Scalindua japonica]